MDDREYDFNLEGFEEEHKALRRAAIRFNEEYFRQIREKHPGLYRETMTKLDDHDIAIVCFMKGRQVTIELRRQGSEPQVLFDSVSIEPDNG